MQLVWFLLCFFAFIGVPVSSVYSSVVINEVLFDPVGPSDTGLEKIELYNSADSSVDIGGWQLYPDGIGYITFPQGMAISPNAFLLIHLRFAGTNGAGNFYQNTASGNMGNTSGSVALFSGEPRDKNTIKDFVQWGRGGETWESAAFDGGIWAKGTFFDIANLSEGNSVALSVDGIRGGALSWHVASLPTLGALNAGGRPVGTDLFTAANKGTSTDSSQAITVAADPGRTPPPSLKAYAGEDKNVLQGSSVEFQGKAFGVNGEPLSSARHFWNLGDGTTKEGKLIIHTYYFPGQYNVSLNVASGEYSGADYLKVTVVRPDIVITEVKTGRDGFIELYNNTDLSLDLGGFILSDGSKNFEIQRNTFIGEKSVLVLANAVTGVFSEKGELKLKDALNGAVDSFSAVLPLNIIGSYARTFFDKNYFVRLDFSTPGAYSPSFYVKEISSKPDSQSLVKAQDEKVIKKEIKNEVVDSDVLKTVDLPLDIKTEKENNPSSVSGSGSTALFLMASIIVGLVAAGGFIFLRL